MSSDTAVAECIETAAEAVAPAWPLHSFVTANPLAGFEDRQFHDAVAAGARALGGDGYPSADTFRRAWEDDRIDPDRLRAALRAHSYDVDPETALERMATEEEESADTATTATDRAEATLTKWLAAFLDQGQAEWSMPNREAGFFEAFRTVTAHDGRVPDTPVVADRHDGPLEVVRDRLADHPADEWPAILEHHLTALPGWTGLIKRRAEGDGPWQSRYPVTLREYLAARLALLDAFDAPVAPPEALESGDTDRGDDRLPLPAVWLRAWEATYRSDLVDALTGASASVDTDGGADDAAGRPDAQLVFCIDTRSEVLRRHVEDAGDYETHGYAGFFGVPMRYDGYDADVAVDACPPIVDAQHRIPERPTDGERRATHDRWRALLDRVGSAAHGLQSNAATAFSFVESTGVGYGAALAGRTLVPGRVHDLLDGVADHVPSAHEFTIPVVDYDPDADHDLTAGLTHDQKVEYAATAFDLLGWERFGRVVAFVGHASETTNNPFDASLDCGACAGNPGGPSARVFAAICNDERVRDALRKQGHDVPEDTVFVAGEHNTTTDEVDLYPGDVPASHREDVDRLRADLAEARAGAAAERAADMGVATADADAGAAVRETERRAADWAQTRPEWGLAGNAAFVIGPRDLTAGLDLDGRAFLHSYDPATDPEGDALAAIMAGPMVVTQWINAQYYFATVDTAAYGSGSKVTQNPVGNVGVYQGNAGDLMTGLPLQSLVSADGDPYHQPLRLSTVIHAPVERVTDVFSGHETLRTLLDNGWLSLTVVDPEQEHRALRYTGGMEWTVVSERSERTGPPTAPTPPVDTTDD